MAVPTIYRSTDASAPVLTGQVGSLIGVLDACLVNGYGSKTAAGWTKAFSGTNQADYLGAVGHYLDVNDAAAGAAGAQEANVRGYESMTALATGTNPFPTTSQRGSPGLYIRKSATADSTARAWLLAADDRTVHLFVLTGDNSRYKCFSFGRIYSLVTSDTYKSTILGHASSGGSVGDGLDVNSLSAAGGGTIAGCYVARGYTQTGTSLQFGMMGFGSSGFINPMTGPNIADGNIYVNRIFVQSTTDGIRGYLRGVYQAVTSLNDGDTFSGTGDFAGRTFVALNATHMGAVLAIETTAWDNSG